MHRNVGHPRIVNEDVADVGRIKPAIMRRQVVFPHPLGPSKAIILPGSIVSDTLSTAIARLYSLLRRSSLTSVDFMCTLLSS
jgi:hypothetical protein